MSADQRIQRSEEEWRRELSEEAFRVAREGGTEPPFSGEYYHHDAAGEYYCVCCRQPLFSSHHKYDSGTGWPSYYQPLEQEAVLERADTSHGMVRTEVLCSRCDAHLGHVFSDGPEPSGLRYCINSTSLGFKPNDQ